MRANARNNLTVKRSLTLEQLVKALLQPATHRGCDQRQTENQQRFDKSRADAITRGHPIANSPYAKDVDRQHYRRKSDHNKAFFDDYFEVTVPIDVVSKQNRRKQRSQVGYCLEV